MLKYRVKYYSRRITAVEKAFFDVCNALCEWEVIWLDRK